MTALIQELYERAECRVAANRPAGPSPSLEGALAPTGSGTSKANGAASTDDDPQYSARRVLVERSRLMNEMKDVPRFRSILIVEDDPRDSDSLASKLRGLFGHDTIIRQCLTLGTAMDAVSGEQPDLVFLDDRLGPVDRAEKTVPLLRKAQCVATIIVISSSIDRQRRHQLIGLGASGAIDKDDLDSNAIRAVLVAAQKAPKPEDQA